MSDILEKDRAKKALLLIDLIGCPRNMLLKLRIEDYLKANGWLLVSPSQIKSCNLVVFCSCSALYTEQRRSLQIIRAVNERLTNLNDPPVFVVAGCFPSSNRRELLQVHRGPAFGPRELDQFDALINATTGISTIPTRNKVMSSERVKTLIERQGRVGILGFFRVAKKTTATIKKRYCEVFGRYLPYDLDDMFPFDSYQMGNRTWCVVTSVGCLGNCSYCTIKFAKGRLKSRPLRNIVEEARQGVKLGYKWISLIADDNGAYGRDMGTNLASLLRQLSNIEGDFSMLVDSLNPNHFIALFDELVQVFTSGKLKRMCLGIQHVNQRILSSMNRSYDLDVLKQRLRALTTALPTFIIDVHLIVGYPGETREEFEELVSFVRWLLEMNPINSIRQFPFSANLGTPAAKLSGQISRTVIRRRWYEIERVCLQHEHKLRRERIKAMPRPPLSNTAYTGLRSIQKLENLLTMLEWRLSR